MTQLKRMPIKELTIDKRYQRPLDQRRVKGIVEKFDSRQLGALEVSARNGKSSVIDGQHRLAALKKLKANDVPCVIHKNLGPEEEAALFVRFQLDRRSLRSWERFRAQVFSGDPMATEIQGIVEGAGYKIGHTASDHHNETISAVIALERVYRRIGGKGLAQTLLLIRRLWSGDEKSTNGYLIQGVADLIRDYGDRLNAEHEQRLEQVAPTVILRRAFGFQGGRYGGGSAAYTLIAAELRKIAKVRGRPRKFKKAA